MEYLAVHFVTEGGVPFVVYGNPSLVPDWLYARLVQEPQRAALSLAALEPWQGESQETPFLNPLCTILRQDCLKPETEERSFPHPHWHFYDVMMALRQQGYALTLLHDPHVPWPEIEAVSGNFYRAREQFYQLWSYQDILLDTDPYQALTLVPWLEEHLCPAPLQKIWLAGRQAMCLHQYLQEQYPDLTVLHAPEKGLDAAIWHYHLETIRDPAQELLALRQALAPHGKLLSAVSNLRYIRHLLALLQDRWLFNKLPGAGMPHPQIRFFSKEWLVQLVNQAGLAVEDIQGVQHQAGPLEQVFQALSLLEWPLTSIQADGLFSRYFFLAGVPGTGQPVFTVEGMKGCNLLMVCDYSEWEAWLDVLAAYAAFIPAGADIACLLQVQRSSLPWEDLLQRLEADLTRRGATLDYSADIVLLEPNLPAARLPALVQSCQILVLAGPVNPALSQLLQLARSHGLALLLRDPWLKEVPASENIRRYTTFDDIIDDRRDAKA